MEDEVAMILPGLDELESVWVLGDYLGDQLLGQVYTSALLALRDHPFPRWNSTSWWEQWFKLEGPCLREFTFAMTNMTNLNTVNANLSLSRSHPYFLNLNAKATTSHLLVRNQFSF